MTAKTRKLAITGDKVVYFERARVPYFLRPIRALYSARPLELITA